MRTLLSFDDVILIPKYSDIKSRSEVDTSTILKCKSGNHIKLDVPLISSPMKSVTETMMAYHMYLNGGLGILHRFNTIDEQVQMVKDFFDLVDHPLGERYGVSPYIGAAVGINGDYLDRASALRAAGVKLICIDVAHGYHAEMKTAVKTVYDVIGDDVHLMVGNIGDYASRRFIETLGAMGRAFTVVDSVRISIGSGNACSTYLETGHGYPTLQGLFDCNTPDRVVQLIADGGHRYAGDCVKSLAAGADACMLGSLLAGSKAAPGLRETTSTGIMYKLYFGSASERAQVKAGKKYIRAEGVTNKVLYTGKLENTINHLKNGIQSGLSYSGARNIQELRENCEFAQLSHSSLIQSKPGISNIKD